jgi:hypothetical protein
LFRSVAISLPLFGVLLVEIGLRIGGYGYSTSFFSETKTADGTAHLMDNPLTGFFRRNSRAGRAR